MINYNPYNLMIGDRIVRSKDSFFSHHGLVIAFYPNGSPMIAECQSGFGVRIVDFEIFMKGRTSFRYESYDFSLFSIQDLKRRVNDRIGLPYHFSNYNCEVFVNDVLFDKKESTQVRNGSVILGIGLCAFAIAGNKSKRA